MLYATTLVPYSTELARTALYCTALRSVPLSQRLCEDSVAEAVLEGFVLAGEQFTLDADREGSILLTNARGQVRVTPSRAGQGIEDEDADAMGATAVASGVGVEGLLNARPYPQ